MASVSTSSESKPKLSPVILEAMARNLSDHDLLRFMLSSKEAFNATLDALSTVDYINIHDENFENEPCIAFKMRGDFEDKSELNYITQSNPLFNFVVNYLRYQITQLKTCDLLEIEPWVLNTLMTFQLQQLYLGIVLPESCKEILKDAPNLTKITFSTFDVFVSNNFIPIRCKKVAVDLLEMYEIRRILVLPFTSSNVVESISLGESKLFVKDYDIYCDDFIRRYWKRLIKFLISSFPSLKVLDIRLGGYTDSPINILNWWNVLKHFIHLSMPSNIQTNVTFDILIPANKWLALHSVFSHIAIQSDNNFQVVLVDDQTSFNNLMRSYIKNRRFPDDIDNMVFQYFHKYSEESSIGIRYYAKWEEYDFDAANDEEYGSSIILTEPASSEEGSSDSMNLHTISTLITSTDDEIEAITIESFDGSSITTFITSTDDEIEATTTQSFERSSISVSDASTQDSFTD